MEVLGMRLWWFKRPWCTFPYSWEDGWRPWPRKPCGDEEHCWRCTDSAFWHCSRCDGETPDIWMVPMENLLSGSSGFTGYLATWNHGHAEEGVTFHGPPFPPDVESTGHQHTEE